MWARQRTSYDTGADVLSCRGEWNSPWSERSWEWDSLSERDKELLSVRCSFKNISDYNKLYLRSRVRNEGDILPSSSPT